MSKFFENYSRCGAVRLAHLLWEQGAAGSHPATSTSRDSAETPQEIGGIFVL